MTGSFRHFTIEPMADGVWAVLHRMDPPAPDAWAVSNAGIVDLGDRTLLFDELMSPDAASELRQASEELTGWLPNGVVYSHAHYDHTWGGSRFPEATSVSSARARAAMLAEGHLEVADFSEAAADQLAQYAGAASSQDPLVRRDAPFFLPYWNGIAAALPGLELRYPDLGFNDRLEIHGRDRRVELVAHRAGALGRRRVHGGARRPRRILRGSPVHRLPPPTPGTATSGTSGWRWGGWRRAAQTASCRATGRWGSDGGQGARPPPGRCRGVRGAGRGPSGPERGSRGTGRGPPGHPGSLSLVGVRPVPPR
jgi:hypothetical protein